MSDRRDRLLGERSAGPFLKHLKVPDRVPVVLPLLLEDHVQALQHGVVFPRVAGAVGRDAVPLQLLRIRGGDHFAYSKRAMAQDQVEVMRYLGFEKFALVGHDRGGRAAHRLALDHPEALTKLVILDIVPTYLLYRQITQEFATIFYHWFLLVQPPPFPETMVQNSAEYFLKCTLLWLGGNKLTDPLPGWISPAVFEEYLRTFRQPDTIHAICEDYRAAASVDLAHDKADLDKKVQCPLLVLWSERGPFHRMYDVLQAWQERAVQAEGKAMPTGHFLPEQMPQELTQEIARFLRA